MKYRYILGLFSFFMVCFSILPVNAQNGSIEGVIKDRSSKETLVGANVILEGTTKGSISDFDGKFAIINISPGVYNLKVSYISYNTLVVEGVRVEGNHTTQVNVDLESASIEIQGATVVAVRHTGTDMAMISSIRTAPIVSVGISSQQIARSQDRDASEVVRRVPGITIMDNRFIVVRGLPQRYNSVWLNNAATPSSEADVKAFSFDVIPSSMIDNLLIFKSTAPELPADFAGGFIKILTKNMPDENNVTINYSSSWAQGTTGKDFNRYQGSKTDWLGFDNGFRALPAGMPPRLNDYELAQNPVIQEKVTDLGRALQENWTISTIKAIPDQRFSLGVQHRFNLGKKSLGTITNLSYSNTYDYNDMSNNTYSIYDYRHDISSFTDQMLDKQYTNTAKLSLMHNWAFFAGHGTKIEFRNLFNQIGWTRTTLREGRDFYNDGRYYRSYEMRFLSRSTYSGQLGGEHAFRDGNTRIDWNVGFSYANKKEPDLKRYRQLRSSTDTTQYYMIFSDPSNPDLSSEARYWLDLYETLWSVSTNLSHKFTFRNFTPELKAGIYVELKDREFTARNFGYAKGSNASSFGTTFLPVEQVFAEENINRTTGIKLMEITSRSDSYTSGNKQYAGYLSAKIPITAKLNLYAGLRVEKNRLTLSSYYQGTTIPAEVVRDTINLFPSANLSYNFNDQHLLRFAWGLSVNRPEFREIAPFYFVDFDQNAGTYGNPKLSQAYVSNFDLRYEYYPSQGETFTIGAFYKNFTHPIELVIEANSPLTYSFQNVESAVSLGIETDTRKSLEFIPSLKDFSLVLNTSIIYSKVNFPANVLQRDRPLQGQSPYIVNAGLYYDNMDKGLMFSILYNVIGERIVAVGRPFPNSWEDIPNIYEAPRHVIDLTLSKRLTSFLELKAGIKDLLDQKIIFRQTVNSDVDMSVLTGDAETGMKHFTREQITKSYRPGSYFTLGLTFKL